MTRRVLWTISGSLAFALAACAVSVRAQDPIPPEVRFSLDADGRVLMAPNPGAPEEDAPLPLVDSGFQGSFANLGLLGVSSFLFGGPSDLASLSDAERFFELLGLAEDAVLLQKIGRSAADEDPPHVGLIRLLAIRAAERRGVKAALPLLGRAATDEAADPWLRTAAREAVEVLEGRPRPVATPELADLDTVLADVPPAAHFVLRLDRYRVPGAPSLPRWARLTLIEVMRPLAQELPTLPAGWITQASELPGVLPYELARQFGNHRIDRAVLALRIPEGGMAVEPALWVSLEGRFDTARIAAGLEEMDVPFARVGGDLTVAIGGGYQVRIGPGTVRFVGQQLPEAEAEAAAPSDAMRTALAGDATAALYVASGTPLPEEVARLRPVWLHLTVPPSGRGTLRLDGRWPDPTGAAALRGLIETLPGLAESTVGAVEAFEPVLDALDAMESELDGDRLTVELPIPDVELGRLVYEAAREGVLR